MRSSSTPRRRDATTTRRATTTTRRRRDDRSDRSRVSRCRARGVERASSIDRFDARVFSATDRTRPTTRSRRHRWRVRPTSRSKSNDRTAIDRCDRTSTRRSNDRRIARSTLGSPSAPTSRPAAQRDGRRHERLGRRQRRFTTPERGTAAATDDDDDDDDTETVDVGAGAAGRVAAEIGIRPAASAESARGGGRRRVARIRCVDDDGATRANDGDGDDEREFLIDRSRARDDARTRRAREGTHAIAISTAPHDGDGR